MSRSMLGTIAGLISCLVSSVASAAVSFGNPVTYTPPGLLASGAEAVAVGDLNGDGRNDVALVGADDFSAMSLFVYYQGPAGTLLGPTKFAFGSTGFDVRSLVIGDINGDGRADVVAGHFFNGVEILRQDAAGGLGPAEFLGGANFAAVAIGDANADGRNDIVGLAPNGFNGQITFLHQNPDGTLTRTAAALLDQFHGYNSLSLGDVTGDGLADMVFLRRNAGAFTGEANVSVFAQLASGGFATAQDYIAVLDAGGPRGEANALDLGDVNGDGRTDVVVTGLAPAGFFIGTLAQNAAGGLDPVTYVASPIRPGEVRVGDLNGDRRADIIINDTSNGGQFGVALQQANGSLSEPAIFTTGDNSNGNSINAIEIADVTGDAIADVTLLDVNFGAVVYPQLAPADPNSPPVANAGPDRQVKERAWVLLNGLRSSDPDGDRLKASWSQISGPPVVLHFSQSFTPVFQAPKVRRGDVLKLQFELTVTDPSGARSSDVVAISVVNRP